MIKYGEGYIPYFLQTSREKGTGYNKMNFCNDLLTPVRTLMQDYEMRTHKETMVLKSLAPVRKISAGQRGGSHMMLKRIVRELSNGVESQNVEFKANRRDNAGGENFV